MKDMKKAVAAQLEDLSDVILTLTGCKGFWGEPELPDCMRVEMESESENQYINQNTWGYPLCGLLADIPFVKKRMENIRQGMNYEYQSQDRGACDTVSRGT